MVIDPETGEERWDLDDGQYVLAGSGFNGGGLRIMRDDPRYGPITQEAGRAAVAAVIGEGHPAIAASAAATRIEREAQCEAGRTLAMIMRDGRRFR